VPGRLSAARVAAERGEPVAHCVRFFPDLPETFRLRGEPFFAGEGLDVFLVRFCSAERFFEVLLCLGEPFEAFLLCEVAIS
jgi:hypothetical protein